MSSPGKLLWQPSLILRLSTHNDRQFQKTPQTPLTMTIANGGRQEAASTPALARLSCSSVWRPFDWLPSCPVDQLSTWSLAVPCAVGTWLFIANWVVKLLNFDEAARYRAKISGCNRCRSAAGAEDRRRSSLSIGYVYTSLARAEPDKLVNYFARRVPDLIELPNGSALGQQIEIELKFWSSSWSWAWRLIELQLAGTLLRRWQRARSLAL